MENNMGLKETYKHLKDLLHNVTLDLTKSEGGNKAASQRVRTGTVKLEKLAKLYRKESIKNEKATKGTKKPVKKAAKAAPKADAKSAKKVAPKAAVKAPVKDVKGHHKPASNAHSLSFKKPSAKLPVKKASFR